MWSLETPPFGYWKRFSAFPLWGWQNGLNIQNSSAFSGSLSIFFAPVLLRLNSTECSPANIFVCQFRRCDVEWPDFPPELRHPVCGCLSFRRFSTKCAAKIAPSSRNTSTAPEAAGQPSVQAFIEIVCFGTYLSQKPNNEDFRIICRLCSTVD